MDYCKAAKWGVYMDNKVRIISKTMTVNEPVIQVRFKSEKTLRLFPEIYIRSFEDAIKANADCPEKLEEIRRRLIGLRAEVDYLQAQAYKKKQEGLIYG